MKKDVESMNRFELINEVERLRRDLKQVAREADSLADCQSETRRLTQEIGRLYSQQTIIAQYLDVLGQEPGMEMWLNVADDLRCNRLISPTMWNGGSRRSVRDRRMEAQGRRRKARRSVR